MRDAQEEAREAYERSVRVLEHMSIVDPGWRHWEELTPAEKERWVRDYRAALEPDPPALTDD